MNTLSRLSLVPEPGGPGRSVQAGSSVSLQALEAGAQEGRVGEGALEGFARHLEDFVEVQAGAVAVVPELVIRAGRGGLGVGAGQDAFVAAEEAVADLIGQLAWDVTGVLDGQVAEALSRVELAVLAQRAGGTGLDTAAAIGAGSTRRLVRFETQRGDKLAQKHLRPERRMDEHVIPADEAQARPRRQRSFGQRHRIHADLEPDALVGRGADEIGQLVQPRPDERVVVVVLGVLGDCPHRQGLRP